MNRQSNKITAIYTRIDRPGNPICIQAQKDFLSRYAEEQGLPNIQFYSDDGYSGNDPNRPDFNRLLMDIEQGNISSVVVHDVGRLYCETVSINYLMDKVLLEQGVDLYATRDEISPESIYPIYGKWLEAVTGGEQ